MNEDSEQGFFNRSNTLNYANKTYEQLRGFLTEANKGNKEIHLTLTEGTKSTEGEEIYSFLFFAAS